MPMQPRFIFNAQQGETPESVARRRELAAAMLSQRRAPQNVGEGLTAVGQAIRGRIDMGRANRAETAGRASAGSAFAPIAEALKSGQTSGVDITSAMSNPWLSDGQKSVAQALLNRQFDETDPMRQLQMEKGRLEIDRLKNPLADYDFKEVDGVLYRTDGRTGKAEPINAAGADGSTPRGIFTGKSVEAQALNHLVGRGLLTPDQAAEVGAGKTITGPGGELIFMTPGGIFAQTPDGQTQPLDAPAPQGAAAPGQREGMIPLTTPSFDKTLTPAQKAVDAKFADEYVDWSATGGYADVEKQIGQLEEVATSLESGNKNLTGPVLGNVPDMVGSFSNPDAIATREAVEEVVQRNLRIVLGAQFTEKEGERLISRSFNPRLDEAENAKRVRRLIEQIKSAAQAKQAAAEYYEKNGTLKGWEGRLPTFDDFNVDSGQAVPVEGGGSDIDALIEKYAR